MLAQLPLLVSEGLLLFFGSRTELLLLLLAQPYDVLVQSRQHELVLVPFAAGLGQLLFELQVVVQHLFHFLMEVGQEWLAGCMLHLCVQQGFNPFADFVLFDHSQQVTYSIDRYLLVRQLLAQLGLLLFLDS